MESVNEIWYAIPGSGLLDAALEPGCLLGWDGLVVRAEWLGGLDPGQVLWRKDELVEDGGVLEVPAEDFLMENIKHWNNLSC